MCSSSMRLLFLPTRYWSQGILESRLVGKLAFRWLNFSANLLVGGGNSGLLASLPDDGLHD